MFRPAKKVIRSFANICPGTLHFSNIGFDKIIPITRLNDPSVKIEPIISKQTIDIPLPNSRVSVEYMKKLEPNTFTQTSCFAPLYKFYNSKIFQNMMHYETCKFAGPTLITIGIGLQSEYVIAFTTMYLFGVIGVEHFNEYIKSKPLVTNNLPLVIIDDFEDKAPYIKIFTMLSNYNKLHFITPSFLENPNKIPNNEKIFHINLFLNKNSKQTIDVRFSNIEYIEYLTREQATHLIDRKLDQFCGYNGNLNISSVTFDISKYYDPTIGKNKIFKPIENFFKIKNSNVQYSRTNVPECASKTYFYERKVVLESSIDYTKSILFLIDPVNGNINYFNTQHAFFKKMDMFKESVIIFNDDGLTNELFNFPKRQILRELKYKNNSVFYINNSSYYSKCIDDIIERTNSKGLNVYVTIIDDELKKLYRGKYPFVDLEIGTDESLGMCDLENMEIVVPEKEDELKLFKLGFEDSQRDVCTGYLVNNKYWINGYFYGKKCNNKK